jgi:hypothetical protein
VAIDLYTREQVARNLIGSVIFAVETAYANGNANPDHLDGILTFAKGMAATYGIPWSTILTEVRFGLQTEPRSHLTPTVMGVLNGLQPHRPAEN